MDRKIQKKELEEPLIREEESEKTQNFTKNSENQDEMEDIYPIWLLLILSLATFSLLFGILIRWQLEASWDYQGEEFPTLSELLQANRDDVLRPLFIVFYCFFTLTAFIFLHTSYIDDTHTLDTSEGVMPSCCSIEGMNTAYQFFTIIYWMSTIYGIFTLLMLFLFDKVTTPDDHMFYATWGFVALLARSWSLYIRRRTKRTSICYVPGKQKSCQDSTLALMFLFLNTTQVVACTVCLILFPIPGNSRFEYGIVFCLSFDPIFQFIDFYEDRICEHAIKARKLHRTSEKSSVKLYKGM